MRSKTKFQFAIAAIFLLFMPWSVKAAPNAIWTWLLPSGLSVDTGTLSPDQTFVMSNGVIAFGSAPCPQSPWLCTKTEIYPTAQAFWALDANTGKVKWTIPLPNGSVIRPVAANQKLIFAAFTNPDQPTTASLFRTLAIDAQTGQVVWSLPRPNWNGDPLLAGNLIITPDEMNPGNWTNPDPTLTAYDTFTGILKWRIHTAPIIEYPSAFGDGMIFALGGPALSYQTDTLTAYDASSGAEIWTRIVQSGACPSYMNGVVFATQSLDNQTNPIITVNLTALNATASGQTLWNRTIGHVWPGETSPACPITSEHQILAYTYRTPYPALPDLVALNLPDGHEAWRYAFPCEQDPLDPALCRQVLWNHEAFSDSMVFAAAGFLYGIERASGNVAWSYGLTADNWNPLGYENGILYALNTPNGLSPNLAALSIGPVPVPEMPTNITSVTIVIVALTLFTVQTLKKHSSPTCYRRWKDSDGE